MDRARAASGGIRLRHVPTPRLEVGRRLARLRGRVACIDVSDGLPADLAHLLGDRLELDLDLARLPLARGVRAGARALGLDPAALACSGEDYELLFTLRGRAPAADALSARLGVPLTELGQVVRRRAGLRKPVSGWRHF